MFDLRPKILCSRWMILVILTVPVFGKGKKAKPLPSEAHLPVTTISEAVNPWRVWSDREGHKLEAEFRSTDGDTVLVRTKEGQIHPLKLAKLSSGDQEFAAKMKTRQPTVLLTVKEAAAKIDGAVLAGLEKAGHRLNAPATDEQFVRRLFLDVAGRIPTAAETASFVDDKAPNKRAKLIDGLIGSAGYNSQMFNWLADMLRVMDDYGKGVKTYVYEEWLKEQIAKNRTWDGLVYDLMVAEGRLSNTGPVGYLLRDRGMALDNLSNTLTTFLGANVACAQCHNHPLAAWTQKDFFGMASYFGATDTDYAKANGQAKKLAKKTDLNPKILIGILAPNLAEVETLRANTVKLPEDYKYQDGKPGDPVAPALIHWGEESAKGAAQPTAPAEKLREQFAQWMTAAENPRFATAIANRLWKRVFGLGVQEPVGDLDDLSKAYNPELLAALTTEMRRVRFDLREFQRVILNTQAYQRQASVTPDLGKGPYLFPGPLLRRMSAEQAWDSVLTLVVGTQMDQYKLHRSDEIQKMAMEQLSDEAVIAKAKEMMSESGGKRPAGKRRGQSGSSEDYDGNPPPKFEGMALARASELPQPAKEAHFLRMFGQSDRQIADTNSFEGGVPQVLMMMNGDVQKVIASGDSMVLKAAALEKSPERQIESLYFSFLGRRPSLPERQMALKLLSEGLKLSDMTWVLFNTREFIFIQ